MISNRQAQLPSELLQTNAADLSSAPKELGSFRCAGHTELQPPHPKTLEKLMAEIEDALDRDQQFLIRGEEVLARWKVIARRMQERLREVLGRASECDQKRDVP